MHRIFFSHWILLWALAIGSVLAISNRSSHAAPPGEFPELLEVEEISRSRGKQGFTFNGGRPYVISVDDNLPQAKAARQKLLTRLHDAERLDRFVIEWFGKETPKRLTICIGRKVPLEAAQAAIAAFAAESELPVCLFRMSDDDEWGDTQRIYVGSLVAHDAKPITKEMIRAILNPAISRKEFLSLLPEQPKLP